MGLNIEKDIKKVITGYLKDKKFESFSLKGETINYLYKFFESEKGKDFLFNLGKRYSEYKIPHLECIYLIDDIYKKVISFILEKNSLNRESFQKINLFFKEAKNACSLGYLEKVIEKDLKVLNILYGKKVESKVIKDFIKSHTQWLFSVIQDIRNFSEKPSIEMDFRKCEFHHFLEEENLKNFVNNDEIDIVKYLHENTHQHLKGIYKSLKSKDFEELLNTYISLTRSTFALFDLLAVFAIKENKMELKIDPLTGLLNRRAMDEILVHHIEISRITEKPITVAMVDIDNFKKVNDTYGHVVGDCVLRKVSQLMRSTLRKSDFIFRYGGEEFLILLPSTDFEHSLQVLEKIRKKIEEDTFECGKHKINITVSIGMVNLIPERNDNIIDIIKMADMKLYEAKRLGKNTISY